MSYKETIDYLFKSTPVFEKVGAVAYKPGLDTTLALDKHLGCPHRSFKTIHVAGTNGKGSVSHTLAAILQAAGHRVGLFTSPHLVDFRERIRVNGEMISEQEVVDFVALHRSFFEPLHPSFFELTTAMAFWYFEKQEVDIAVVEVGLGGRLDSTNIITPILSIITNISFDHTQFLGHTLEMIATEKAGIIKEGVPVVIGEANENTRPVFARTAFERRAPIIFAEDDKIVVGNLAKDSDSPSYVVDLYINDGKRHGKNRVAYELRGYYQEKNANTVLWACEKLRQDGWIKGLEEIRKGFAHVCEMTGLVGRWQQLRKQPTVICDTGHNVGGWEYLSAQLKRQDCRTMRIVFGMVDDKDIDTVLGMLPTDAVYYFTQATTHRAIPSTIVAEKAANHGLDGKPFATVADAYQAALADAGTDDFIFVGGSSYVVADLLAVVPRIA
ncbi:MAG: bifunctional folylpolyglutamate synthase/dihydrofolate synthase [Prevotella sp.]|nr:bifunctional folylpolyglutamate synthase/dihydrofolate synthase [Prevotella sp.]